MSDIRADLSQYYPVKSLFEKILGRAAFLRVKDYGSLSTWRSNYERLLKAIEVSIDATVEVVDDEWRDEVSDLIDRGRWLLLNAKSIDELHAGMVATLGELAFLQIGFVPRGHMAQENVRLVESNWKLDVVRSVQYVQSQQQRTRHHKLTERSTGGKT